MNTKKIVAALLLSSSLASAVSASAAYSAMAKYKKDVYKRQPEDRPR